MGRTKDILVGTTQSGKLIPVVITALRANTRSEIFIFQAMF
jgi:hypothetical protein